MGRHQRVRRGSVLYLPIITPESIARFWSKVDVRGYDDCWLVKTRMLKTCYPHFDVGGRDYAMHRFSWALHNRAEPGSGVVCHSCDTPHCVNPRHLWIGTDRENVIDSYAKRGMLKRIELLHCLGDRG